MSETDVWTADHCVVGSTDWEVVGLAEHTRRRRAARRGGGSSESDVARLVVAGDVASPAFEIADRRVRRGDLVTALRVARDGIKRTAARVLDVDSAFIYTTPASCPGDSGSPLVDATGRLLGVASASAAGDCERGTSLFGRLDH